MCPLSPKFNHAHLIKHLNILKWEINLHNIIVRGVGRFTAWTVHRMDGSSHGRFIAWTVHRMDGSSLGRFIACTVHRMDGSSLGRFIASIHQIEKNLFKIN